MGLLNKALLKFDVSGVHLRHEVHLCFYRFGKRMDDFVKLIRIKGIKEDPVVEKNIFIN